MKKQLEHITLTLSMTFIVLMFLTLMFWWLFPYKTSTQTQPYIIISKEVKQGELLYYQMDYCKYTDIAPTVQRQFVDGIIYAVPASSAQLKRGCGTLTNSIKIPQSLPVGEYYIHTTVIYKMNPIRTIANEYVTEKFTVIK